jgi:hypothetical protein
MICHVSHVMSCVTSCVISCVTSCGTSCASISLCEHSYAYLTTNLTHTFITRLFITQTKAPFLAFKYTDKCLELVLTFNPLKTNTKSSLDFNFHSIPRPIQILKKKLYQDQYQDLSWLRFLNETNTHFVLYIYK